MKKRLVVMVCLFCVGLALFAQDQRTSVKPVKKVYFGITLGAFIFGNVQVGDATAGSNGIQVLDIDADSGGAAAGFTLDVSLGYQVTPKLTVEGTFTFGVGEGFVENGRVSSETFYANNGWGSAQEFTARDLLSWSGGFGSLDIGVSYELLTSKKSNNPFYINGKLSIGTLGYIHDPDKAGGLRYAEVTTKWHGGEEPGPDRTSTYLVDVAEGFYLKPGFDFGVKLTDVRFLINTHAKVFPAAFTAEQKAVITDGFRQRTVQLTLPTWIMPSVTLGVQCYFR
jgi:hypothetical protein